MRTFANRRRGRCRSLATLAVVLAVSSWVHAAAPSPEEQLWLQLINRFRQAPAAELDRLANYRTPGTGLVFDNPPADISNVASALDFFEVDAAVLRRQFRQLEPAPPLAWSEALHASAEYYSNLMIDRDEQSHTLDQYNLLERVREAGGFDFSGGGRVGENIFAFTESVEHGHAGFLIDWGFTATGIQNPPGHRDSLINPEFRELGVAIVSETDRRTSVGPYVVTQHLGVDYRDGPFVTGAIFQDRDRNDFYSIGEGVGDVSVELQRLDGQTVSTTSAYATGGYRIDISDVRPGTYRIALRSDAPVYWSEPFAITNEGVNVGVEIQDPQFDIDSMSRALRESQTWNLYDLNADGNFDASDRDYLIEEVYGTYRGDANLDREFNSSDLVLVLRSGEYEDSIPLNSTWRTGDWNGDAEFTSTDLIVALTEGGYEVGPRTALVPEPNSSGLGLALLAMFWRLRTCRQNGRSSGT